MPSKSTAHRHFQADRLERNCVVAMVSCKQCRKRKSPCRLSSLDKRCTNCVRFGSAACEPEEVPLPDYSKIDREMEKLEKMEDAEEAILRVEEEVAETALRRARLAREKLQTLRRQKKLLRREEQKVFDAGMETVAELEQLESLERLNSEIASTNPGAPLGAETIDWSVFWDSSGDTGQAAGGNS
jgi:hypothetical protein